MANKDKKNLFINTIALATIQILNYVLPFISLPYLSRILDVDRLGLVFFAQSMMDYFWRLTTFGFDFSGVRKIAINQNKFKRTNLIFNSILCVQIFFIFIGFIILSSIIFAIEKFRSDWLVYYFSYLSVIGNVFIFTWFYQGKEKMKFIAILNVITRIIALILIFTFIKQPKDYYLVPLFNSLGVLFAGIVSIVVLVKEFKVKLYIPKLHSIIKEFKYSSEFFLTKVAMALYRQTNAFVLGIVATTTAVAYYVAADKIFWAVLALYLTFVNALFPYMSKNKDIIFFKKIFKWLILLSIGASLFLFVASKWLILIFYSAKLFEAIKILQIFSISFAFYIFVDILGFPLLGAFGYVKETNMGYIIGGLYNLIGLIMLYLLQVINIYSVAILVSSTYAIMFLHRWYYVNKYKLLDIKENING